MILKKLDFLSPPVTLYHNGLLSHPSIVSGIIYIISLLSIFIFAIYYFIILFKREEPEAFFFNHFIEDAGTFPLNSSSLFHFVSLYNVHEIDSFKGFDFESFRLIGLNTYLSIYEADKNLSNFDHWLYGYCNNETDTVGIKNIINHSFFNISACIKKYFNSSEQKYYDSTDTANFKWPKISHGTYNSENEFYLVVFEKCDESTLNLIMGEGHHCKKSKDLNKYFNYGAIHFYFIDQFVDILNYKEPNRKYFYRIENKISKDSCSQNNLNFNPSVVKTNNGLLWDNIYKENSYVFERNDVIMTQYSTDSGDEKGPPEPRERNQSFDEFGGEEDYEEKESMKMEENDTDTDEVLMAYYFWLENRMQDYIRNYKKIQDILSNIGGIYQVIIIFAGIINNFYNNYIILCDTQLLIFSSHSNIEKNENNTKPNNIDNLESSPNSLNSQNIDTNKSISTESNRNSINSNSKHQITKKNIVLEHSSNINNKTYINEKQYKFEGSFIHKDSKKIQNNEDNIEYPNFIEYFKYKIGYRDNKILKNCEKIRKKIISEEYFIKMFLIINRLLKEQNININEYQNDIDLNDIVK